MTNDLNLNPKTTQTIGCDKGTGILKPDRHMATNGGRSARGAWGSVMGPSVDMPVPELIDRCSACNTAHSPTVAT